MAIVYRHRRGDTGEVFYVGIGKNINRAFNIKKRSKFWKSVYNKVGHSVEIIQSCNNWEEAFNNTGINNISEACRGNRKTAGGFIWKYKKV